MLLISAHVINTAKQSQLKHNVTVYLFNLLGELKDKG
jgi:hypothetical protein